MNLVWLTVQEYAMRLDGARGYIRQDYKQWDWNVTIETATHTRYCVAAGKTATRQAARAQIRRTLAVYDRIRKRRRCSRYEAGQLANRELYGRASPQAIPGDEQRKAKT